VCILLVLTQAFPVVCYQNNDGIVPQPPLFEFVKKVAHPVIHIGNFTVVGIWIGGFVRMRRIVAGMRIVIVKPKKKGLLFQIVVNGIEPLARQETHLGSPPLHR